MSANKGGFIFYELVDLRALRVQLLADREAEALVPAREKHALALEVRAVVDGRDVKVAAVLLRLRRGVSSHLHMSEMATFGFKQEVHGSFVKMHCSVFWVFNCATKSTVNKTNCRRLYQEM